MKTLLCQMNSNFIKHIPFRARTVAHKLKINVRMKFLITTGLIVSSLKCQWIPFHWSQYMILHLDLSKTSLSLCPMSGNTDLEGTSQSSKH